MTIHKNKECRSVPYLRLLDKPSKKERLRREVKEACRVISFVWLLGMAFMSQFVITDSTIADIFSVMLLITAALQAAGNR